MGKSSTEGGRGGRLGRRPRAWRARRREDESGGTSLREALLALLEGMGGTPERAGLQRLWDNWETALGPELAGLALPLGHQAARKGEQARGAAGAVLLLGAEDAMLLQELRFRGAEILERVNGFLGRPYFCAVKVSLPLGRGRPERSRERPPRAARAVCDTPPAAHGTFLPGMDSASPVARCYARFARLAVTSGERVSGEHEEDGDK